MKNCRSSECGSLQGTAGEVRLACGAPATPRTGNAIICYLPQQRTIGGTKLPFLVTAAKRICQHCFLLPAFSGSTMARLGKRAPELCGEGPEGAPGCCLWEEAQLRPWPKPTDGSHTLIHDQQPQTLQTPRCVQALPSQPRRCHTRGPSPRPTLRGSLLRWGAGEPHPPADGQHQAPIPSPVLGPLSEWPWHPISKLAPNIIFL